MSYQDVQKCYQRILITLSYFDIFEYPLTAYELFIFQYDIHADQEHIFSLNQIIDTLTFMLVQPNVQIEAAEEFYFLKGNYKHVITRKQRYVHSINKYKKSLWKLRVLSYFPFVKAIAVCNSLPLHNAHEDGDIDMFIVTHSKRIWSARFFVVSFLKLFRLRPRVNCKKDKLCPSFFISEQNLNVQAYQLQKDAYLRFWVATVLFVYGPDSIEHAWYEKNSWLKRFLPQFEVMHLTRHYKITHNALELFVKRLCTTLSSWIAETYLKSFQLRTLPSHIATQANKDSSVVINDTMLKFHDKDKRRDYQKLFEEHIQDIV